MFTQICIELAGFLGICKNNQDQISILNGHCSIGLCFEDAHQLGMVDDQIIRLHRGTKG